MSKDEPKDLEPVEVDPSAGKREREGIAPVVKVGIVFVVLGAALSLLLFGSEASDALVYSKLVNEVLVKPEDFKNRELRVEGDLKQGSIQFREEPCEYRFVIGKEGKEMPVRFPQCVVPDTFRDGMGITVTVQGRIEPDGSFHANQVVPRCPSKYEMQQKQRNGERAPHPPNAPPAPSS